MRALSLDEAEDEDKRRWAALANMHIERAQAHAFELKKQKSPILPRVRDYLLGEQIGRGAFGRVFRAIRAGKAWAVKVVDAQRLRLRFARRGLDCRRELWHEVETLSRLTHPFVLRMEEAFWEGESLYIITELLSGPAQQFSTSQARQLIEAVRYLHEEVGIAHGDIKPSNVMLDAEANVRLIDFNSSRSLGKGPLAGTPAFHPPEAKPDRVASFAAADVWALGATLNKLLPEARSSLHTVVEACLQPLGDDRPSPAALLKMFPK